VVQGALQLPHLEAATIMNNYGWELYRIFAMFMVLVGLGLQIISGIMASAQVLDHYQPTFHSPYHVAPVQPTGIAVHRLALLYIRLQYSSMILISVSRLTNTQVLTYHIYSFIYGHLPFSSAILHLFPLILYLILAAAAPAQSPFYSSSKIYGHLTPLDSSLGSSALERVPRTIRRRFVYDSRIDIFITSNAPSVIIIKTKLDSYPFRILRLFA
jgi:hypothetical protein